MIHFVKVKSSTFSFSSFILGASSSTSTARMQRPEGGRSPSMKTPVKQGSLLDGLGMLKLPGVGGTSVGKGVMNASPAFSSESDADNNSPTKVDFM